MQSQNGDNSGPSGSPKGRNNEYFHLEKDTQGHYSAYARYGNSISPSEKKVMSPRSESDEQRMIRLATEASLRDWDNDHGYGKDSSPERSSSSRAKSSSGKKKKNKTSSKKNSSNLDAIGENSNLIDFGAPASDQLAQGFSSIEISNQPTSDVSVLGFDDDRTTASFMQNAYGPAGAGQPPAFAMPPQNIQHAGYGSPPPPPPQQPHYRADPTYTPPHYHQPIQQQQQPQVWNSAVGFNPTQPQHFASSTASFAMAPPPTLDDFQNAFGSSMSVMPTASLMSPSSSASVVTSSMSPQYNGVQYQQQHASNNQAQQPWEGAPSQNHAPPANNFDPLKLDPFAS